jgi:hypothetical protein
MHPDGWLSERGWRAESAAEYTLDYRYTRGTGQTCALSCVFSPSSLRMRMRMRMPLTHSLTHSPCGTALLRRARASDRRPTSALRCVRRRGGPAPAGRGCGGVRVAAAPHDHAQTSRGPRADHAQTTLRRRRCVLLRCCIAISCRSAGGEVAVAIATSRHSPARMRILRVLPMQQRLQLVYVTVQRPHLAQAPTTCKPGDARRRCPTQAVCHRMC